jgi:hypothetical protein
VTSTKKAPSVLRDAILSVVDVHMEEVVMPEWGGITVLCKGMTGRERSNYFQSNSNEEEIWKYAPRMIISNVLDPDTKEPIFSEKDLDAVADKSGLALDRLAKVVSRLSGFGEEAKEELEEVAESFQPGE